jgi:branched-chain amino acid transport system permease protein
LETAIQQAVNAVALGGTYAMLALGLAVVFSVMRMINFAHGELMTASGYAYAFAIVAGLPFAVALVLGVTAAIALVLLLERVAFRPLRGVSPTSLLITSFAVAVVLQTLFQSLISPRPQPAPMPGFLGRAIHIGDFTIGSIQFTSIVVTLLMLAGLAILFRYTMIGISIRAAAMDFRMARLMGVRANRVIATAFAISGLLAGVSGLLWVAQRGSVDPLMGFMPVLKAFICAVLGGLGSLPGAVLGGFALGIIETALQAGLSTEWAVFKDPIALFIVIAILAVRPRGLLPTRIASRA